MNAGQPLDIAAAFRFLRALRKNNDRAWFEEHREAYDTVLRPGFEDLVAGLLIAAAKYDERFSYVEPRRCIFRIYRDVRFSNDKTPYKTRLSAFLSPRGWRGSTPGFYVALEPGGESMLAAGVHVPEKPMLADLRRRFADGDAAFERLMRSKRFGAYLPISTDPLVRMPAGFPREHPRGDYIRARRYMVSRSFTDVELSRGDAFDLFRTCIRDTMPFVRWLDASLDRKHESSDADYE
ncbi:MAG: DUF2461 domain-containing protein [Candidatus Velthaea sp.]|jgi:uncharacterized protein (TIGR02453 family)